MCALALQSQLPCLHRGSSNELARPRRGCAKLNTCNMQRATGSTHLSLSVAGERMISHSAAVNCFAKSAKNVSALSPARHRGVLSLGLACCAAAFASSFIAAVVWWVCRTAHRPICSAELIHRRPRWFLAGDLPLLPPPRRAAHYHKLQRDRLADLGQRVRTAALQVPWACCYGPLLYT